MEISTYEIFSYQIVYYLIKQHHYQVFRVVKESERVKGDIWVINALAPDYPVICISSDPNISAFVDSQRIREMHREILERIQREGPVLILNTNPESVPIDNVYMRQIRISDNGISNPELLRSFKNIDRSIHNAKNNMDEMARLTREIEEIQLRERKSMLKQVKHKQRPNFTMVMMGICILVSLFAYGMIYILQDYAAGLVVSGAFYKMNIIAAYEYWRLLTAGFVQSDPIVLIFFMYVLYKAGKLCEPYFQTWRYAIILLMSIIVGNMFMLAASGNVIASGIGAGIFGVYGAYIVLLWQQHSFRFPVMKILMLRIIIYCTFVCLMPGISIFEHFGGLLCGVVLALLFAQSSQLPIGKQHVAISGILLLVGMTLWIYMNQSIEPIEKDLDYRILDVYRNTPMNRYGQYLQTCYIRQYEKEGT